MFEPIMKFEPPKEFTINNVCYWEPESKVLMIEKQGGDRTSAALLSKAKKFLEGDCIVKENNEWICLPLKGYNKTKYNMTFEDHGWICNCQGFQTKIARGENPICSHIVALKQKLFLIDKEENSYGINELGF